MCESDHLWRDQLKMLQENYLNKLKELPEYVRQLVGLATITIVVLLSFAILNAFFGQGEECFSAACTSTNPRDLFPDDGATVTSFSPVASTASSSAASPCQEPADISSALRASSRLLR